MLFAIHKYSADTCGNSAVALLGYCEFNNQEEAEAKFPPGFLAGYRVEKVEAQHPEEIEALFETVDPWHAVGL